MATKCCCEGDMIIAPIKIRIMKSCSTVELHREKCNFEILEVYAWVHYITIDPHDLVYSSCGVLINLTADHMNQVMYPL